MEGPALSTMNDLQTVVLFKSVWRTQGDSRHTVERWHERMPADLSESGRDGWANVQMVVLKHGKQFGSGSFSPLLFQYSCMIQVSDYANFTSTDNNPETRLYSNLTARHSCSSKLDGVLLLADPCRILYTSRQSTISHSRFFLFRSVHGLDIDRNSPPGIASIIFYISIKMNWNREKFVQHWLIRLYWQIHFHIYANIEMVLLQIYIFKIKLWPFTKRNHYENPGQ